MNLLTRNVASRGATVDCYHTVFGILTCIAESAYYIKFLIYNILFSAASEALRIIAVDRKYLDAKVGMIMGLIYEAQL